MDRLKATMMQVLRDNGYNVENDIEGEPNTLAVVDADSNLYFVEITPA